MIQEIIAYLIIGAAIALAVSKMVRKLNPKKKIVSKMDFKKETFSMQHNCSDCSAECMLRNAVKPLDEKNNNLCKSIEIKQS